jgi:hypothetical protein
MILKITKVPLTALAVVILAGGMNALADPKQDAYEESLTVSKQIKAIHDKAGSIDCFLMRASGKSAPQALVDTLLTLCDLTDFKEYREDFPTLKAKLNQRFLELTTEEEQAQHHYTSLIRISKGQAAE